MEDLNLQNIDPELHAAAREMFKQGSPSFVFLAGNTIALEIVRDNVLPLRRRGIYEEALIQALTITRTNHHHWREEELARTFRLANKINLRRLGDPIPTYPVTVYRGISGQGKQRHIRGWSWTASLDIACWFALRFQLARPIVMSAIVMPSEILHCTNERGEMEFIVKPANSAKVPLSLTEMRVRAERQTQIIADDKRQKLAKLKAMVGGRTK